MTNFVKIKSFYVGTIIIVGLLLFSACNNSSSSNGPNVGNWIRNATEFTGTPRTGAVTFTIDNKVYVGLGYNGNYIPDFYFKNFYVYDGNTWKTIADFEGMPRERAVAFVANGKAYVGLGYNRNQSEDKRTMKDFWEYDPATNKWTQKKDFPTTTLTSNTNVGRYNAVAFSLNGVGYVGTGYDGLEWKNDFYKYDPAADAWSDAPSLPRKREKAVAVVYNGAAYVACGVNNGTGISDIYSFDGSSWTKRTPDFDASDYTTFSTAVNRSDATAFVLNDRIYFVGGQSTNGLYSRQCIEYNPAAEDWTNKTDYEGAARIGAISFVLNGRVYVGTGQNGTTYFDNFDQFDPAIEVNTND